MFVRAYLRASTKEQDANRARASLRAFAKGRGLKIAATYVENESGASLQRPELFRLLADSEPGDLMLIEQVDRLSRLNAADWNRLKAELYAKQVRVVALDLPTSHQFVTADDFTGRMLASINGMMLDMLAAISRKDYEDRRRRQVEGIARNKSAISEKTGKPKYAGRPEDAKRNAGILSMLRKGQSWNSIIAATGCSRSTLARLAKRLQTAVG